MANPSAPAAPIGDNGAPGCGYEEKGDPLRLDERGVRGVPRESRDLGKPEVDIPSEDCLRWGVDVGPGRITEETLRESGLSEDVGEVRVLPVNVGLIVVGSVGFFPSSPSFHCKCRIMDLVAH